MNKTMKLHQITAEANPDDALNGFDVSLIETVWCELDKQLPRERVNCIVSEVARGFKNAAVKTFLPIFIHRRALERLRQELNETESTESRLLNE
ncbi:MAG: three-helix bundle dimerization domain-containing protein [Anaerolineales bacterium]